MRRGLRRLVAQSPSLYRVALHAIRSPRRQLLAGRSSDIVIDGFPRSGNTYAVCALIAASDQPVRIARHIHLPVQFKLARRYGKPAVLLIRDPLDAAVSLLIREPELSASSVLDEYIAFYEVMRDLRPDLVVCRFQDLIRDPYRAFREVNARFGARLPAPRMTRALEGQIRELVISMDRRDQAGLGTGVRTAGLPNPEREAMKESVRSRVLSLPERALRDARLLYSVWASK